MVLWLVITSWRVLLVSVVPFGLSGIDVCKNISLFLSYFSPEAEWGVFCLFFFLIHPDYCGRRTRMTMTMLMIKDAREREKTWLNDWEPATSLKRVPFDFLINFSTIIIKILLLNVWHLYVDFLACFQMCFWVEKSDACKTKGSFFFLEYRTEQKKPFFDSFWCIGW